jgi:hypothetical protein
VAHSRERVLLHPPRLEPKYTPWQLHVDGFSNCDQTILETKVRMPWYWNHDVSGQNECGQRNHWRFYSKERICCKFIGEGSDAALTMSKTKGRWRQCDKLSYLKRSDSAHFCGKSALNAEKEKGCSWLAFGTTWGLSELTSWGKSSLTMVMGWDLELPAVIKMLTTL